MERAQDSEFGNHDFCLNSTVSFFETQANSVTFFHSQVPFLIKGWVVNNLEVLLLLLKGYIAILIFVISNITEYYVVHS